MDQGKVELEKLKSTKFARSYKEQNGVDFHLDKDKKLPASILIFVVFILLLLIWKLEQERKETLIIIMVTLILQPLNILIAIGVNCHQK